VYIETRNLERTTLFVAMTNTKERQDKSARQHRSR